MAENEPLTPEKQLLKLIENPKQALPSETVKREGKKWFSFGALKGRLLFWKGFSLKKWFSFKKSGKSQYSIASLNRLLRYAIFLTVIYFGYSAYQLGAELKNASNLILKPDMAAPASAELEPELKNISYYLDKIRGRNIFSAKDIPAETKKESEGPTPAQESDKTKDYSLVGIAWSGDPEAMIEDKKVSKTYFVKRGQTLDGGVQVVTIFKDKVILNLDGKEFELR